jgi:hypothetical protein
MKNLIKLLFVLLVTSCATQKTVKLTNGEFVTQKKYDRMVRSSYKKAIRKISKKEKNLFKSTKVTVESNI